MSRTAAQMKHQKQLGLCTACDRPAEAGKTGCQKHLRLWVLYSKIHQANLKRQGGLPQLRREYTEHKHLAKRRKIPTLLTFEEFRLLVVQPCVWCGGFRAKHRISGLDRKQNRQGYTCRNTQPCCWTCNWMKNALSATAFIRHLRRILSHQTIVP